MILDKILKNKSKPKKELTGEVYQSCSELSMYIFVKCTVTGDYTYLIKSGDPGGLQEAWVAIQDEYTNLSKDANQTYLLKLAVQIETLDKKLIIIQSIVNELAQYRSEQLIKLLQEDLGFPFQYIDMDVDLKKTITKAKFDLINLRRLESEYKVYMDDHANDKEVTELDYHEQMTMLSKWQQCKYTLHDTTVAEYIALINRFNADNKPKI